tara:strand:- start:8674 stop:8979 length:306 start_codon:yes stop_codon:yes gene_type:complete
MSKFTENYYSDPKVTHPEITINEPIPYKWISSSYTHDLSPSFTYKGLQIFVTDEKTQKLEQLPHRYSIQHYDTEKHGHDAVFLSSDWNKVLEFVNNYEEEK